MKRKTANKLYRGSIRFIRTATEVIVAVILYEFLLGEGFADIEWIGMLTVSGLAGIIAFLSLYFFGSPKVCRDSLNDGKLLIDKRGDKDIYRLDVAINLERLETKKQVTFEVVNDAEL